jgi:hypothetical protein
MTEIFNFTLRITAATLLLLFPYSLLKLAIAMDTTFVCVAAAKTKDIGMRMSFNYSNILDIRLVRLLRVLPFKAVP